MITVLEPSQISKAQNILVSYFAELAGDKLPFIYAAALIGHAQVWFVHKDTDLNSIFITVVSEGLEGKVVELVYMAGRCNRADLRAINDALSQMKEHAGADRIELKTKHHFGRAFRRFGWQ